MNLFDSMHDNFLPLRTDVGHASLALCFCYFSTLHQLYFILGNFVRTSYTLELAVSLSFNCHQIFIQIFRLEKSEHFMGNSLHMHRAGVCHSSTSKFLLNFEALYNISVNDRNRQIPKLPIPEFRYGLLN